MDTRRIYFKICKLLVSGAAVLLSISTIGEPVDFLTIKRELSEADILPNPKGKKNLLFYLQRSTDKNTIVYELNPLNPNEIHPTEPVNIYWIRYEQNAREEEISFIENKFAYGIEEKKLGNSNYELRLVSYPKHPLYLIKASDGKYRVFTRIAGNLAVLNRIYVQVDGGSFWSPKIGYIELSGTALDGKDISEKITP